MGYDEALAQRIREATPDVPGLSERKMFGGLAFMLDGHMCFGVVGADLMLRLGAEAAAQALTEPHVRPMDFTGKPMKGMVYVGRGGLEGKSLDRWLARAAAYVHALSPKG